MLASPSTVSDPNWYFDSRVLHHLASNINNLSINSDYQGDDQVTVGNGQILFQGKLDEGLYKVPGCDPSTTQSAFDLVGERTSLSNWHNRLGHPNSRVVRQWSQVSVTCVFL
ncbi:hypothetical protein L6164_037225 [Bauhinia variegata]|uniref:Uncharacterized protein n=1 Tax=Bauhinia variegata TaxID=167791 RepID=A0ACB9KJJ1_BAUVA|nr:hypothetical protein L6164_037225 [Bauhinia variegata]